MRLIDADAFERKCRFDGNIEDVQDVIYALRDFPPVAIDKEIDKLTDRISNCSVAVGGLLRALEDKGIFTNDELQKIIYGGDVCAKPMDMRGEE